jgi:1-acyl-sn-glycerol-3-phosphate acyltransferase
MWLGFLRSLLITAPLIIVATIVYGSISLAVSFFDKTGVRQMLVARAWARMLLRIGGVQVTVHGLDKIDPGAGYVVVSNHASYMDTPVVLAHVPVQFRFLAKEGLFSIPFLGGHLRRAGHIPVPRGNPREALKTMADAGRVIRERRISVLIFPEGGRSLEGLREFKEGAALIAIKAGAPILPITLRGTMEVLPMHSLHMRPGRVTICIGDPVPTAGMKPGDRARLTQQVHDDVQRLLTAPAAAVERRA